ncbi:MAG: flagellar biosynthesis protein FlhB, partial [Acidobacteriota bacterium]
ALSLAAFLLSLHVGGSFILGHAPEMFVRSLAEAPLASLSPAALSLALAVAARNALLLLAPIFGGGLLAVGLATALQGEPVFSADPLKIDFARLNPAQALRPILTGRKAIEALQISFKGVLFTAVAWSAVRGDLQHVLSLGSGSADGILGGLAALIGRILGRMAVAGLLLAAVDLVWQRWRFLRDQRMSEEEIKEESKETEGHPEIKRRIRSQMQILSRRRLTQDVKKASVVVVNPVHVAVALRYLPGKMDVPVVVAKGRQRMARRIRDLALKHRIPVIQDPPLARLLEAACLVGHEVPEALYKAVAGVLAWVMHRGRGERRTYQRQVPLPTDLPLGPAALRAARRAMRRSGAGNRR